jgi:hypothetical protein
VSRCNGLVTERIYPVAARWGTLTQGKLGARRPDSSSLNDWAPHRCAPAPAIEPGGFSLYHADPVVPASGPSPTIPESRGKADQPPKTGFLCRPRPMTKTGPQTGSDGWPDLGN